MRESIDVLRGGGPPDVRALTVRLGAEMLVLGGVARDRRDGARRIEAAIATAPASSGSGWASACRAATRARSTIRAGCPAPATPARSAPRGAASSRASTPACSAGRRRCSGAGRLRKEDRIAPGAAILLRAKIGQPVARGDLLATVEYDDAGRERVARPLVERAFVVGGQRPRPRPLVLETLVG